MAKSYSPGTVNELLDIRDAVVKGRLGIRNWNRSTDFASNCMLYDFELIETTGFRPSTPEKELVDLLESAIDSMNGVQHPRWDAVVSWLDQRHEFAVDPYGMQIPQAKPQRRIFIEFRVADKNMAAFYAPAPPAVHYLTTNTNPQSAINLMKQMMGITFDPALPDYPPIRDNGTITEPIIAYRDFMLEYLDAHHTVLLRSRNGLAWPKYAKMRGVCNRQDGGHVLFGHDAPDENCHCGIYAFMEPDHKDMIRDDWTIWGEVYLWGNVLTCETGYRAQYAYPKTIFLRDTGTEIIKWTRDTLEAEYGVPVLLVKNPTKQKLSAMMDNALSELLAEGGETK